MTFLRIYGIQRDKKVTNHPNALTNFYELQNRNYTARSQKNQQTLLFKTYCSLICFLRKIVGVFQVDLMWDTEIISSGVVYYNGVCYPSDKSILLLFSPIYVFDYLLLIYKGHAFFSLRRISFKLNFEVFRSVKRKKCFLRMLISVWSYVFNMYTLCYV